MDGHKREKIYFRKSKVYRAFVLKQQKTKKLMDANETTLQRIGV